MDFWFQLKCSLQGSLYFADIEISDLPEIVFGTRGTIYIVNLKQQKRFGACLYCQYNTLVEISKQKLK